MFRNREQKNGYAIAIAWPQTWCKQSGAWYDKYTKWLGFNKEGYYQVGHAAVVLVSIGEGVCHYFDFGRYHAPFKFGRVRNASTDNDLAIKTKAMFNNNDIINLHEIIEELKNNLSCHGTGTIIASYSKINFNKALSRALLLQNLSPIKYGPFTFNGTNCSRFVRTIILAGEPSIFTRFNLLFPPTLTPTPKWITSSLGKYNSLISSNHAKPNVQLSASKNINKANVLPEPEKHSEIPYDSKWLAGEGCGSWFSILAIDNLLAVKRFSEEGLIEANNIFRNMELNSINLCETYNLDYPSNDKIITLVQEGVKYRYASITNMV